MRIEFDPDKDAANLAKHGVSLVFGAAVWSDGDMVTADTVRLEDEEHRFKAIGMAGDRLWTAVHVKRGDAVRLISVRKANDGERKIYDRARRQS